MTACRELAVLRELSARLAENPLLVQASTGNTSVKVDGVLWIKASGKWLAQADHDDFLVPVDLRAARSGALANTSPAGGRCASIETAMHAVLPQAVVIHVHSVNVIAWAVRQDAERQLAVLLQGLRWNWIPYTPSGIPLAHRIEQIIVDAPDTNVLVLGNHGLVICAETCLAAQLLLAEVEERLHLEPRPALDHAPAPAGLFRIPSSAMDTGSFLPKYSQVSALATDPHSRRILAGGVLYPCQAIFLPGTTPALDQLWTSTGGSCHQPFFLMEAQGIRLSSRMTRAEFEILNGLAEVVQRIDPSATIRYLQDGEVRSLLAEGAGSYRRTADPDYAAAAAN